MLKVLSLFSGIGGLDAGVIDGMAQRGLQANVEHLVEANDYCQQVLARHHPDAQIHSDVRTTNYKKLRTDILVGGFPCTDISTAKKDAEGLAGARSGLWVEQLRAVKQAAPMAVYVENVAALRGRGLWRVLLDLRRAGYISQYDVIPAKAVGAPHQRDRLFIVAQHEDVWQSLLLFQPEVTDGWSTDYPQPWADPQTKKERAAVRERLKALGNAVVPDVAAVVGEALAASWLGDDPDVPLGRRRALLAPESQLPRAGYVDGDYVVEVKSTTTGLRKRQHVNHDDDLRTRIEKSTVPTPMSHESAWRRGYQTIRGVKHPQLGQLIRDEHRRALAEELDRRIANGTMPTPTATDWKGGGKGGDWGRNLKQGMGGTPSPEFVEWLMGFPLGWSAL